MTSSRAPESAIVVGAGMVGLATAWHLLDRGVRVTVLDKEGVAAGSSWGNAGWLTPGLATPLPEPAVLAYGIKAVLSPSSPVYVPPAADVPLGRFMAGFLQHSTAKAWKKAMASLVPINSIALDAFAELEDGGVQARTLDAGTFVAAYRTETERRVLLEEIEQIRAGGQALEFEAVDGDAARAVAPVLSDEVGAAILLHGQRFIDPGTFVHSLADAVRARGGVIRTDVEVDDLRERDGRVEVLTSDGRRYGADVLVLATGAWLGRLARRAGVHRLVQAGRGYSFSVPVDEVPEGPVYLPAQRVACTPIGDRLRVAGMMEFRRPDAPLDPRRIRAIVEAARPLLRGADLDSREDEWVGSRPCTVDGLPLIGRSRFERVWVAGGHGMWGITLGPATGRLLADAICTGRRVPELAPFDPLR